MKLRDGLVSLGVALALFTGCKSKVQECMERTDETHARALAACSDDPCKQKAEADKLSWYEACKELK